MENLKTEIKALFRILRFFGGMFLWVAGSWLAIVSLWAIFGN
jgi:hypothetical protein